jgi:hypothetical protein
MAVAPFRAIGNRLSWRVFSDAKVVGLAAVAKLGLEDFIWGVSVEVPEQEGIPSLAFCEVARLPAIVADNLHFDPFTRNGPARLALVKEAPHAETLCIDGAAAITPEEFSLLSDQTAHSYMLQIRGIPVHSTAYCM